MADRFDELINRAMADRFDELINQPLRDIFLMKDWVEKQTGITPWTTAAMDAPGTRAMKELLDEIED